MTRRWRREHGMVTAELAVAIPAAVFVVAALVAGVVGVGGQLRCIDAAREAARAAARGESDAVVQQIAAEVAPDGATVTISGGDDTVTVVVRATYSPLGGRLGEFTLVGEATARREPTAGGGADEGPAP
ncbi:TadE family type IV pilus minor pilin [Epidermidibacterium keratini]|nr:TadE family type IV pilus minor pilin [Epidermidibacterium keratini]